MAAGAAAYANSFAGTFVFDDKHAIVEKAALWQGASLVEIVRSQSQTPVLAVTLAANYAVGGVDPFGYHLVNLAIHILAGLTLFGIVRRTLWIQASGFRLQASGGGALAVPEARSPRPEAASVPEGRNPKSEIRNTVLALAVALLWLVHPLQTESVTYIIQRKESLMGLFFLLTIYCLIRACHGVAPASRARTSTAFGTGNSELGQGRAESRRRAGGVFAAEAQRTLREKTASCKKSFLLFLLSASSAPLRQIPRWPRPLWGALAVIACALGMGTKQVMVTAPLVALVYDRTFLSGTFRGALRRSWPYYLLLGLTWLVLAGSLQRYRQEGLGRPEMSLTPLDYALTQFGVILRYLRLSFWPAGLCLDYGWPIARQPGQYLLPALAVLALVAATGVLLLGKHRALGFLGAWFFLTLAPTSSVIVVTEPMAEHRMYLPLAAVAAAAVVGGYAAGDRLLRRLGASPEAFQVTGQLAAVVTGGLVALLGYLTFLRNWDYTSELRMWADAVAKRPANPRGQYDFGLALARAGKLDDAVTHYRQAIALKPTYGEAYNNLATALAQQKKLDEAIENATQAVRCAPREGLPRANLGSFLAQQRRFDEAAKEFDEAIRLAPNSAAVRYNYGLALAAQGKLIEAERQFRAAIELRPRQGDAYNNLSAVLLRQDRAEEAAGAARQAVGLSPRSAQAHANLGSALLRQGRHAEAAEAFGRALELDPFLPSARAGLAAAREKPRSSPAPPPLPRRRPGEPGP